MSIPTGSWIENPNRSLFLNVSNVIVVAAPFAPFPPNSRTASTEFWVSSVMAASNGAFVVPSLIAMPKTCSCSSEGAFCIAIRTTPLLLDYEYVLLADEILDAYPLQKHRCLLDVGGGDGSFLIAAAARCQQLQLMLFDLPSVAKQAAGRLAESSRARAQTFDGDFFIDHLPPGADVVSLVRVIHDHDDPAGRPI